MTFWVDEQISPKFAVWFAQRFQMICHSVDTLGYFNTPDLEIFEKARSEKVVFITKDRDFREMVLRNGTPPQVVWVTCGNTSTLRLQAIFEKAFRVALDLLQNGEALVEIADLPNDYSLPIA
jgi:predicted nuclease of predicted toxin-antitoxin system